MPSKKQPTKPQGPDIQSAFASPFRHENSNLENALVYGLSMLDNLKPERDSGGAYLGDNSQLTIDFDKVRRAAMPAEGQRLESIIKDVAESFKGLPNWGHPLNLSNVCPQENIAAIVAAMLTQIFSPNIIEGEYAWNTARAELESSAMLANLAGWNSSKAGGIYTYGGSGCWMYHVKYAISRVLRGSREEGIRTDAKVICSDQAHYAMLNSTDWTGLGTNNIIRIKTISGTNEWTWRIWKKY